MFLDLAEPVSGLPIAGGDRDLGLAVAVTSLTLGAVVLDVAATAVAVGAAALPYRLDIVTPVIHIAGALATTVAATETPDLVWLEI